MSSPTPLTSPQNLTKAPIEGILLLDKPRGKTSFFLVSLLRKVLRVKKIGHAGTLDPFATGLMVMLIGREYTKKSNEFLSKDKEYLAEIHLGIATDSYDSDGVVLARSSDRPSLQQVEEAIAQFQGEILQVPPMFSAKKINGERLYKLARRGEEVERKPERVTVRVFLLDYEYPYIRARIVCSKGTYVRSIAHDLGVMLQTGAHLSELRRTRSGSFTLDAAPKLDLTCLTAERVIPHILHTSCASASATRIKA